MTIRDLAKILGISKTYCATLIKNKGMPQDEEAARVWMEANVSPHCRKDTSSAIKLPDPTGPVDLDNAIYSHRARLERAVYREKRADDMVREAEKQGAAPSILKKFVELYAETQRNAEQAYKRYVEISLIEGELIKKSEVNERDRIVFTRLNKELEDLADKVADSFLTDRPDELKKIIREYCNGIKQAIISDVKGGGVK